MMHHAGKSAGGAGVDSDHLENHARHVPQALAQFEDKLSASKFARVPLGVVIHAATEQRAALQTLVA